MGHPKSKSSVNHTGWATLYNLVSVVINAVQKKSFIVSLRMVPFGSPRNDNVFADAAALSTSLRAGC
jgi:hypothetical protein